MDRTPKPRFQGFYSLMGTLNCPNQCKIPGGRAFGELFDARTPNTAVVDRCLCQMLRNPCNYWGCQSHTKYVIILTGLWSLSYPIGQPSNCGMMGDLVRLVTHAPDMVVAGGVFHIDLASGHIKPFLNCLLNFSLNGNSPALHLTSPVCALWFVASCRSA